MIRAQLVSSTSDNVFEQRQSFSMPTKPVKVKRLQSFRGERAQMLCSQMNAQMTGDIGPELEGLVIATQLLKADCDLALGIESHGRFGTAMPDRPLQGVLVRLKSGLRIELHRVPRDLYCFGSFPSDVISKSENGGGIAGKRIKFGRLFGLDYTLVKSSLGRQGPQRISGSRQNGPRIELKARRNSYSPFDQSQSFNT